ncbi:MAG: hypothetical protein GDA39_09010, partial [Hyphomonadaceae bacterium]|nr:hypothetical protein [Hyphomonadaceae bacterium]
SDQPLNAARPARANKARPKNIFSHKPRATYTDGATGGVPDDLKRIKGVGSKFEDNLNALGICYFRQIAAWTTADIKQFEEIIGRGFAGRVARDEWVKQARKLADES